MPRRAQFTSSERGIIRALVAHYEKNQHNLRVFQNQVLELLTDKGNGLVKHVHSFRWRMKEPEHLRDKLERKLAEAKAKNRRFGITEKNLFVKINDLVGLRILHLHTRQIAHIDAE